MEYFMEVKTVLGLEYSSQQMYVHMYTEPLLNQFNHGLEYVWRKKTKEKERKNNGKKDRISTFFCFSLSFA